MKQAVNKQLVRHIAQLANIPISSQEEEKLAKDFSETLEVVDKLQKIDTQGVEMTHQVTGLKNITREDKINKENMFTQKEALANASHIHNGFFVVERLIDAE